MDTRPLDEQRDAKGCPPMSCITCLYGYNVRINPTDLHTTRECRAGPPLFQIIQTQQGAGQMNIPRLVPDEYFCHAWAPDAAGVNGKMLLD